MRLFLCAIAALSLTACGGANRDFRVKLEESPEVVLAHLEVMDPNSIVLAAGLDAVETSQPDGNSLLFTLPAPDGKDEGTFLFEVESAGNGASLLDVTVELPYVTRSSSKGTEFLSETEVERALKKSLQNYGRQLKTGSAGQAAVREAGDWIGFAAVGIQNWKDFEKLAENAAISQIFSGEDDTVSGDWGDEGWTEDSSDFAYADNDYSDYENYESDGFIAEDGGDWGEDTE